MPVGSRSLYVDVSDPALGIACPRCGLLTARFSQYCQTCGYQLWPSAEIAARAFRLWQEADPAARSRVRVFDTELPVQAAPPEVDFEARAHELGIHLFPSSANPFLISLGAFFLMFAVVPLPKVGRIIVGIVGIALLLLGVVNWVLREDVQMYEESAEGGLEAAH